jgi:hypothetical protein
MIRYGVHAALEAEADRLLRESLAGVTSQSAKSDILTPWKMQDRISREVYTEAGVPEPATWSGIYHRAWNPSQTHLNSNDGVVRRRRTSTLRAHVDEHGGGGFSPHDEDS